MERPGSSGALCFWDLGYSSGATGTSCVTDCSAGGFCGESVRDLTYACEATGAGMDLPGLDDAAASASADGNGDGAAAGVAATAAGAGVDATTAGAGDAVVGDGCDGAAAS